MTIRFDKDEPNKTEIIEEIKQCSADVVYFAEKYFYIINFKNGKQLIKLSHFQKNVLYNYQEKNQVIVLAPRQSFKTTSNVVYALWFAIYNNDKFVALLSNNANLSKITLLELKTAYESLPDYLKPAITKYNSKCIEFDNGSQIVARVVTEDVLRGCDTDLVILDEFAFVDSKIAESFFNSVYPVQTQDKKLIISSTPSKNGVLFEKLWKKAVEVQDFRPIRVYWWEVEGKDEDWKDQMINIIGKTNFDREYNCVFESDA